VTGLFFKSALLPNGWAQNVRIVIDGERIHAVETDIRARANDEVHDIALPGVGNVHSHAFQRGMAGLSETRGNSCDSFWTWRDMMYRFIERMNPEDVEAVAEQAYVEMLEAGFTRVGEFHYLHHDVSGAPYRNPAELASRIAAAAQNTGIGLTLLPVFYAHADFNGREPAAGQRRFVNSVEQFSRLMDASRSLLSTHNGAVVGIAPHSLRAVTPDELAAIVPLAKGGPIHIHVAEQTREVEDCIAWSGKRPVEWLLDQARVDDRWCLIHATHTNDGELRRMAQSGAIAGLCPVTEANLGDGIFNAREFLAASGHFAVGSDSNVLIGLADELRQLEYSQRLGQRARNVMAGDQLGSTGRAMFDKAIAGGAQALGAGKAGIVEGAFADIISLDPEHVALAGRSEDALIDGWIFAARNSPVDCVWTLGRKVVSKGRHHKREAVESRFRKRLEGLLAA
jgi:formiminoglutamate deiminase